MRGKKERKKERLLYSVRKRATVEVVAREERRKKMFLPGLEATVGGSPCPFGFMQKLHCYAY